MAGAAGSEIMDKGGDGAENTYRNFGSATLLSFIDNIFNEIFAMTHTTSCRTVTIALINI